MSSLTNRSPHRCLHDRPERMSKPAGKPMGSPNFRSGSEHDRTCSRCIALHTNPSLSLQSRQDAILGALMASTKCRWSYRFPNNCGQLMVQVYQIVVDVDSAQRPICKVTVADGCSSQIMVRRLRIPAQIYQDLVPFGKNHLKADTNNHPIRNCLVSPADGT